MHHYKRAALVKEWREAFFYLAKEAQIPALKAVEIFVTPVLTPRGRTQDIGACYPAYKAAQDGCIDAGVLPDDSPRYVRKVTFFPPVPARVSALQLVIREVLDA